MTAFDHTKSSLQDNPQRWLVTGAAGFIGSHLVEFLLQLDQQVLGLDNFATGRRENLASVEAAAGPEAWKRFQFIEGSITNSKTCLEACADIDFVLHHAALGSVPASIDDPLLCSMVNVGGTANLLDAARRTSIKRIVYASSSAIYGDDSSPAKTEDRIGEPLSPYAASKRVNEIYARNFARTYSLESVGLRYFNVFGPRQDPNGAYAAVIPKWIASMLNEEPVRINGTGETSRDFCFVGDIVQANVLAATTENKSAINEFFNVALNELTSLNKLFSTLSTAIETVDPSLTIPDPVYCDFRPGDILRSLADIDKSRNLLGFQPLWSLSAGLEETIAYYRSFNSSTS